MLSGYKTYIVAICALIGGVGLYLDGKEDLAALVSQAGTFLGLIMLRLGIAKDAKK